MCSYERGHLGDLASYVNGGNVIRAPCRYYGKFDGPPVGQGRAISHILSHGHKLSDVTFERQWDISQPFDASHALWVCVSVSLSYSTLFIFIYHLAKIKKFLFRFGTY